MARSIRKVIHHAGHDPTSKPGHADESAGFENMATAFVQAKFLAWTLIHDWDTSPKIDYGKKWKDQPPPVFPGLVNVLNRLDGRMKVPVRDVKTLPMIEYGQNCAHQGPTFFPGLVDILDNPRIIMQVPKTSRLLCVEGNGGFCATGGGLARRSDEEESAFATRKGQCCRRQQLEFEGYYVEDLRNGDIVCPGSKNQAHSDAIIVTEFLSEGLSAPGLIFSRNKFSTGDASTTVQAADITDGLDLLVKERGFLFQIPDGDTDVRNQIAKLRVEESNIVYCWNVLRKTARESTLKKAIQQHAKTIDFKGSVVVAVSGSSSKQAASQYGDTFQDIALIGCS
ncbi:MAG: hypothetical protein AAF391_12580 [Bacteroidota bacterium]